MGKSRKVGPSPENLVSYVYMCYVWACQNWQSTVLDDMEGPINCSAVSHPVSKGILR
jgi:hypothetical protein